MEPETLYRDDGAVSPVVGVILMVAITVILAAGTASFALGFGDTQTEPPPQVSFDIEYAQSGNGNLTFRHVGGDTVEPSRISITADVDFHPAPGNDSGSPSGTGYRSLGLDTEVDDESGGTEQWADGELRAGTGVGIVGTSPSSNLDSATVSVVYESEDGDRTTTLVEWEGPDA